MRQPRLNALGGGDPVKAFADRARQHDIRVTVARKSPGKLDGNGFNTAGIA
jgi:hypothetical protein